LACASCKAWDKWISSLHACLISSFVELENF
jgi:hypothetical protein